MVGLVLDRSQRLLGSVDQQCLGAGVSSRVGRARGSCAPSARSEEGCVEAWFYNEVVMDGMTPIAHVLTVFFDEDGYVCSTFLTDGGDLSVSRDRL